MVATARMVVQGPRDDTEMTQRWTAVAAPRRVIAENYREEVPDSPPAIYVQRRRNVGLGNDMHLLHVNAATNAEIVDRQLMLERVENQRNLFTAINDRVIATQDVADALSRSGGQDDVTDDSDAVVDRRRVRMSQPSQGNVSL